MITKDWSRESVQIKTDGLRLGDLTILDTPESRHRFSEGLPKLIEVCLNEIKNYIPFDFKAVYKKEMGAVYITFPCALDRVSIQSELDRINNDPAVQARLESILDTMQKAITRWKKDASKINLIPKEYALADTDASRALILDLVKDAGGEKKFSLFSQDDFDF